MTHDEAFKQLTKRSGLILRQHGFKGSGQNFKRDLGDLWQGINFQKTQWRIDATHPTSFTLNLALHFPRLRVPRYTDPRTFDKFTPSKADQSLRVGRFLPGKGDEWWDVDEATFDNFWPRFEHVLTGTVVPTMDAMANREGIAAICRTMPWITSYAASQWLGKLAPPAWDPKDEAAGLWMQDQQGHWWGPGEW